MTGKDKGKAKEVTGKRKLDYVNDKTGGGRKRKNRNVLQFFEDTADVDESEDDSDDSDFSDDFFDDDFDALPRTEPAKGQSSMPFTPKEEMVDEEEFDRMMEERFGDASRFIRFAGDEFDDKIIEPNSFSGVKEFIPTMWKVKCTVGRERLSAFCLMQKFADMKSLGTELQIISALSVEHMKGFVYIEAEKQRDINEACQGIPGIYATRVQPVPRSEVSHLFSVKSRSPEISVGIWARVKSGNYKGDLAQVVAVNNTRKKVTVKLVPRIDLQALAAKFGGGYSRQKAAIPAPRLISSSELEEFRPLIQFRRDRDTGNLYEVLDGLMLKDGYVFKKVSPDSLSLWGVVPTKEELLKFEPSENEEPKDLEWLSQLYGDSKKKRVMRADKGGGKGEGSSSSGVTNGFELYNLVCFGKKDFGVIVGMDKDDTYRILKEGSDGPVAVTVEKREIKSGLFDLKLSAQDQHAKTILVNDTVKVLEGPSKDKQGSVRHIYRGIIFLFNESEEEHGGYFTCKSSMCEKVKLDFVECGGKDSETGPLVFEDTPSSPRSPLSPKKPWQAKENNREFNRGDGDNLFTIGQTLRIRIGPLKGYLCRVIALRRSDVTVKLDSQQKVLTVKCEHLSEVQGKSAIMSTSGDPDLNSSKPFDLLGTEGGSGGWMDNAATSDAGGGWNAGGASNAGGGWNAGGVSSAGGGWNAGGASSDAAGTTDAGGGWNAGGGSDAGGGWNAGGASNSGGGWNAGGASNAGGGWNAGGASSDAAGTTDASGGWNAGGASDAGGGWNAGGASDAGGGWNAGGASNAGGGWTAGAASSDAAGMSNAGGGWNSGGASNAGGGLNAGGVSNERNAWSNKSVPDSSKPVSASFNAWLAKSEGAEDTAWETKNTSSATGWDQDNGFKSVSGDAGKSNPSWNAWKSGSTGEQVGNPAGASDINDNQDAGWNHKPNKDGEGQSDWGTKGNWKTGCEEGKDQKSTEDGAGHSAWETKNTSSAAGWGQGNGASDINDNQDSGWNKKTNTDGDGPFGLATKSNWNAGNNSNLKPGSSTIAGNENKNSSWNSGNTDPGNQISNWGKKSDWNSDSNKDSNGGNNSSWNTNKSSWNADNENKNSLWGSGNADPTNQDSNWGKKRDWNSGSGDTNQNTNWRSNSNWGSGNPSSGAVNEGQNETTDDGTGGGNWRGGYRGRGGSDRGGFRGRGFRGRGERGDFGARGERGDFGGSGDRGGFRGRGERGGFRGRGRSDREGFGGRWESDGSFGGRGRGRSDQSGGWNNRGDSGEDGSFDWKKGSDNAEGWKNGSGSGTWNQGNGDKDGQRWGNADKERSSWSQGGGSNKQWQSWSSGGGASDKKDVQSWSQQNAEQGHSSWNQGSGSGTNKQWQSSAGGGASGNWNSNGSKQNAESKEDAGWSSWKRSNAADEANTQEGGWSKGSNSNSTSRGWNNQDSGDQIASWGQPSAQDKGPPSSGWNSSADGGAGSWGKKNDGGDKGGW